MKGTVLVALCAITSGITAARAEVVTFDTTLASPDTNPVSGTNLSWYNGSGNGNVQGGWTVATGGGVEIGLNAILRQVNSVIDSPNGVYYVPAGIQTNPAIDPTHDAWNFRFSIDLNPGGNTTSLTLGQITASLRVTDLSAPLSPVITFDPTLAILGDTGFGTASGMTSTDRTVGLTAAEWSAQNSLNPLTLGNPFYNPSAPDMYEFQLNLLQRFGAVGGADAVADAAGFRHDRRPGDSGAINYGPVIDRFHGAVPSATSHFRNERILICEL